MASTAAGVRQSAPNNDKALFLWSGTDKRGRKVNG